MKEIQEGMTAAQVSETIMGNFSEVSAEIDSTKTMVAAEEERAKGAEQGLSAAVAQNVGEITVLKGNSATKAELNAEAERAQAAEELISQQTEQNFRNFSDLGVEESAKMDGYEIALTKKTNTAQKTKVKVPVYDMQNPSATPVGLVDEIFVEDMKAEAKKMVDAEAERAQSAEGEIRGSVESLGEDLNAASEDISKLEVALEAEKSRAQEAEQSLSTEITEAENRVDERVTEVRDSLEDEVQARSEAVADLEANTGISECAAFDTAVDYAVGDVVKYEGRLYRFTADHAQGEWIGTDVEKWSERKETEWKVAELDEEVRELAGGEYKYDGLIIEGYTYPKLIEFRAMKGVTYKVNVSISNALTKDLFIAIRRKSDDSNVTENRAISVGNTTMPEYSFSVSEDTDVYVSMAKAVAGETANLGLVISFDGSVISLIDTERNRATAKETEIESKLAPIESRLISQVYSESNKTFSTTSDLNRIAWLPASRLPQSKKFKIKCHLISGNISGFYAYAQTTGYVSLGKITIFDEYVEIVVPDDVASAMTYFGYYIHKNDVKTNGSVSVEVMIDAEFDILKNDVEKLKEDAIVVDPSDCMWERTTNPIERIDRSFNLASIFLNWGFVGDSLSSGEHNCFNDQVASYYDAYDYSWGQYLCRMLGVSGYNFSFGGQTTKGWCNDKAGGGTTPPEAQDKRKRTWSFAKQNPKDVYIIALGENDRNHAPYVQYPEYNIPCGDYRTDVNVNNYLDNADTFAGWYAGIIQRLKSVSPRAKFFVVTLPKTTENEMDNEWNEQIRGMSTLFDNVYVIDLFEKAMPFTLNSGTWNDRYRLGFHLTAAGYQYFACLVAQYIDWIIRGNFNEFKYIGLLGTDYNDVASCSLTGVVTDGSSPISGAIVSLVSDDKKMYAETDIDGNYTIRFVPIGGYNISVGKIGSTTYTESITISGNTTKNLIL